MSSSMFQASVIIPSHNRAPFLQRTLVSLAGQDFPFRDFEVIVSADTCTDGTAQMVQDYSRHSPFKLRLVAHEKRNASATRNFGAQHAQGSGLIFLDDDIEAAPSLVSAHMAALGPTVVTVGRLRLALPPDPSQWHLEARLWWEDRYRELSTWGYRVGYRDFFSGNCGLSAECFRSTGGFDSDFKRLEDYEYGFRLLQSGARLVHVPEAIGIHHDTTDLAQWISRMRDEGEADVRLGSLHPVLRRTIFRSPELSGTPGRVQRAAFVLKKHGDGLVRIGLRIAGAMERLKLRRRRNSVVYGTKLFNYWRGVAAQTRSIAEFKDWAEEETNAAVMAPDAPCLEWTTLPEAERLRELLAEGSRKGIRVLIDGIEVFTIPPEPWSEPLRVEHIELKLSRVCSERLVPALVPACVRKLLGTGM